LLPLPAELATHSLAMVFTHGLPAFFRERYFLAIPKGETIRFLRLFIIPPFHKNKKKEEERG
jgi:hypothetical protein